MEINEMITLVFYGMQIAAALAFYLYYTRKNKEAEKLYWNSAKSDEQ